MLFSRIILIPAIEDAKPEKSEWPKRMVIASLLSF